MTSEYVDSVSARYIELYEKIIGDTFQKADVSNISFRVKSNVESFLANL